jgi:DNA invertase Pin-like site-specific DNA recombinase
MKRVCAYCRVSTEQDDQLNSLENQKRYFEEYIGRNLDWEFCGLYVDEGISGTSVAKRTGFKKMIADAEARRFDLLLTKEISRFARNTLDSILYTRKLKELGVGVVFVNDNINTLDADAELRLTIMSSIAQEESRKTSERVKWGQKRSMEKGVVFGARPFGYNLQTGKLTINDGEAKTVRLIFDLYLSGMGTTLLRKELENRGIPSPNGSSRWKHTVLLDILKNEKYIGVLKQRKQITVDYLSHKRKRNEGEEDSIIIENNHASIIDIETFNKAQKELSRRRNTTLENGRYSNRYVWSGKIKCAYCGSTFKRRINNSKSKNPQIMWQCAEAEKYGSEKLNAQGRKVGCNCQAVHEQFLKDNFLAVLDAVIANKNQAIEELRREVRRAIAESPNKGGEIKAVGEGIERLLAKKSKIIDMFADGMITKDEFASANALYIKQAEALNQQLLSLKLENGLAENLTQKLAKIDETIEAIVRLKEFGDSVCQEILHKVVVKGRDKVSFYLTTAENTDPAFFKIPLSVPQY